MQWICSFYLAVAFSRKKKSTPSVCFVPHTENIKINFGMYIKEVIIENIRAVAKLEMKFPQPAGWHVLIGDNITW